MKGKYDKDDSGLVASCISGDPGAWSILAEKYAGLIRGSIGNRLRQYGIEISGHDIEDICQEVFCALWKNRKLEKVKNKRNITYWLSIVSGNMAVEYMRDKRDKKIPNATPLSEELSSESTALSGCAGSNPAGKAVKKEMMEKIEISFEALSWQERIVAKLYLYYGKKYDEISGMLNLPAGTVSSYINRAKEKLRKRLGDLKDF